MAGLLSSMRDADGRITIAGFMDDVDPPSAAERAALAKVPAPDSALREELLLGGTESGNAMLAERNPCLPQRVERGHHHDDGTLVIARAARVEPPLAGNARAIVRE